MNSEFQRFQSAVNDLCARLCDRKNNFGVREAFSRSRAKDHLKNYGWSYRTAAPVLGVTYTHLSLVLNGQRDSRRLLAAVNRLPKRSVQ